MKLSSIRHRLIALIGLCLIAMLTLVSTQLFYVNRLVEVQTDTTLLLNLNNETLQLRRLEKDFMLRRDVSYAELFEERAKQFAIELNKLESVFNSYALPIENLDTIRNSFAQYRNQFADLITLQLAIGVDETSGQQGEFRRTIHQLEETLGLQNLESLSILLLQLRRNEKDFLQRLDPIYVSEAEQTYQQLRQALVERQSPDQIMLLDSYQEGFMTLVSSYQEIGLTPDTGVQGNFRAAAHALEEQLTNLGETLNPLIQQRERDVMVYGFAITSVTAIILLTLLARNFVRLQRALSTFLLFFHQSKREYQLLDTKKMGFAEFETLATVANEMVNARRDMEGELKIAQDELAKLKSTL